MVIALLSSTDLSPSLTRMVFAVDDISRLRNTPCPDG